MSAVSFRGCYAGDEWQTYAPDEIADRRTGGTLGRINGYREVRHRSDESAETGRVAGSGKAKSEREPGV